MSSHVRLFIRKVGLFSIPFVLYALVVVVVDPYQFFPVPSPVDAALKREISYKLNYAMWKMLAYERDPVPNVLLGDSRMMAVDPDSVRAATGRDWTNLAYGGGTLNEAVATFHFARERVRLREVVIGVSIDTYNGADLRDRTGEVLAARRNPLLYLFNNNVTLATWKLLKASLTGTVPRIGRPIGDKDAFWRRQLQQTARIYYGNHQDPARYRRDLRKIAAVCRDEGIALSFIIFPTHTDLQEKIAEYGLAGDDARMRRDLAALGTVYDFNWPNAYTRDRARFRDPYHFGPELRDIIIASVWGDDRRLVRVYGPQDPPAGGEDAAP